MIMDSANPRNTACSTASYAVQRRATEQPDGAGDAQPAVRREHAAGHVAGQPRGVDRAPGDVVRGQPAGQDEEGGPRSRARPRATAVRPPPRPSARLRGAPACCRPTDHRDPGQLEPLAGDGQHDEPDQPWSQQRDRGSSQPQHPLRPGRVRPRGPGPGRPRRCRRHSGACRQTSAAAPTAMRQRPTTRGAGESRTAPTQQAGRGKPRG